jgi:hypothetical protein
MREIKEVLHLYLGCNIQWVKYERPITAKLICYNIQSGTCVVEDKDTQYMIELNQIKAIELRKLSDMTEEEARELAIIYSGDNECKRVEGTASNWWYFQCFRK